MNLFGQFFEILISIILAIKIGKNLKNLNRFPSKRSKICKGAMVCQLVGVFDIIQRAPGVYMNLKPNLRNQTSFFRICICSFGIVFGLYLLLGVSGYGRFHERVHSNVLLTYQEVHRPGRFRQLSLQTPDEKSKKIFNIIYTFLILLRHSIYLIIIILHYCVFLLIGK